MYVIERKNAFPTFSLNTNRRSTSMSAVSWHTYHGECLGCSKKTSDNRVQLQNRALAKQKNSTQC